MIDRSDDDIEPISRNWYKASFTLSREKIENASNVFCPHYAGGILKTQQSPIIVNLCLRKTRTEKSHDYRDAVVFEKLRFQNVFRPHENKKAVFSNSSDLKSVFEKLRFQSVFCLYENEKSAISNFSGLENVFRKDPFSWRIMVDGRKLDKAEIPPAQCDKDWRDGCSVTWNIFVFI